MNTCVACGDSFLPARTNQKYCSRTCQKAFTHNASRAIQNSTCSLAKRRKNLELYDLALRLGERYYRADEDQRLGYLNELINQARNEPGLLREVLTNRTLLRPNPDTERWKFWRGLPTKCFTISQLANRFCVRFWGFGVVAVVNNRCPEPPTGEVFEEPLALAA